MHFLQSGEHQSWLDLIKKFPPIRPRRKIKLKINVTEKKSASKKAKIVPVLNDAIIGKAIIKCHGRAKNPIIIDN